MKSIICPVSNERIPENLPRITAFFVLSSLLIYIITGFLPIVIYLGYDFIVRGYNKPHLSLFNKISVFISKNFINSKTLIDKAPKLFAARIGGFISILIILFHVSAFQNMSIVLSGLVILLSTLECVIGFCAGCYIYSFLIFPFFGKTDQ